MTTKKRADDFEIGESIYETPEFCTGVIVSKMNDPNSPTRAYLLVRSEDGRYTIYGCLQNALTIPFLTRQVPEEVMRQFLFDAFLGQEVYYVPGRENVVRCPVLASPEQKDKEKKRRDAKLAPVSVPVLRDKEGQGFPDESARVEEGKPIRVEVKVEDGGIFMPEIDFP